MMLVDPLTNLYSSAYGKFPPIPKPGQSLIGFILTCNSVRTQKLEISLQNLVKTGNDVGVLPQETYAFVWDYTGGYN